MCTCKQKSKKPAGSPGNFNYVFTCTKENGIKVEIKVTAGNDNEAKALAELECQDTEVIKTIAEIISDEIDGSFKLLVNVGHSKDDSLWVTLLGKCQWFEIPASTIKIIKRIGYGFCENNQFPLVKLVLKKGFEAFQADLEIMKKSDDGFESSQEELTSIDEVTENIVEGFKDSKGFSFFAAKESPTLLLAPQTKELSGKIWVQRFPTSKLVSDLISPFRENIINFNKALTDAGAVISIGATFRPTERAFLMYTSYRISRKLIEPENAGSLPGVNIEWVHLTLEESIAAANEMVKGYGIVSPPAFPSNHSGKTAIDMNITWVGKLKIKKADNTNVEIEAPTDSKFNDLPALHQVAASYGVKKLIGDYPHWSDNGH